MSKTLQSSGKVTLVAVNKSVVLSVSENASFYVKERVIIPNTPTTPRPYTHTHRTTKSKPELKEVGFTKENQENVNFGTQPFGKNL